MRHPTTRPRRFSLTILLTKLGTVQQCRDYSKAAVSTPITPTPLLLKSQGWRHPNLRSLTLSPPSCRPFGFMACKFRCEGKTLYPRMLRSKSCPEVGHEEGSPSRLPVFNTRSYGLRSMPAIRSSISLPELGGAAGRVNLECHRDLLLCVLMARALARDEAVKCRDHRVLGLAWSARLRQVR
ncbi:hypothetical protein B0H34DRAFT_96883 [Crassisporium funariophilum]|nr:hypothetical protein B0H34DRAFT_96883 [Crassisporium funariophilum]